MKLTAIETHPCEFLRDIPNLQGEWRDEGMHGLLAPYYAAIETSAFDDLGALVSFDGTPAVIALANSRNNAASYFNLPIRFIYNQMLDDGDLQKAFAALSTHFIDKLGTSALNSLTIQGVEHYDHRSIPDWQMTLLGKGAQASLNYKAVIDLTQTEREIWSDIRKSYRSLINWGKKNFDLVSYNDHNANKDIFNQFQEFHKQVAGRVTRPQESWDEMFALLQNGNAELVIGWHENNLVAATYIYYDQTKALYGTGVYDRNCFDKPISHWPLYQAILNAKERGQKIFELGQIYQNSVSSKEQNIAFFKKGFTSQVHADTIFTLSRDT